MTDPIDLQLNKTFACQFGDLPLKTYFVRAYESDRKLYIKLNDTPSHNSLVLTDKQTARFGSIYYETVVHPVTIESIEVSDNTTST